MIGLAARIIFIGGSLYAADAMAAPAAPTPPKPAPGDPSALSGDFWGDWTKTRTSESFTKLTADVGSADKSAAAIAIGRASDTQSIVNMAIDRPEEAAKLLETTSTASSDPATANALATVVSMVASPKTIEAAVPLVAPEAQARVETMTANLSTGISGLPGIYLGDVPHEGGTAPAGYTPVAGGSLGCPGR